VVVRGKGVEGEAQMRVAVQAVCSYGRQPQQQQLYDRDIEYDKCARYSQQACSLERNWGSLKSNTQHPGLPISIHTVEQEV